MACMHLRQQCIHALACATYAKAAKPSLNTQWQRVQPQHIMSANKIQMSHYKDAIRSHKFGGREISTSCNRHLNV